MSGSTLNAVPFRSTIFYTAAGTPAALGTVFTVGANGIQSTTNALGLQSLIASTMTASTVSFSTMTASTILTQASTITLAQNVNVPNRFVEIGCDLANSMYFDFHSSDGALPDYSTRIISQGGATTGTGNLNMYASTIGLVATNGVGIGTTVPSAALHIKNAASAIRITGNLTNASTRPAVSTTPGAFEIRGSGAFDNNDDGFLRLSAGGGTTANQQAYIDLSGYSTVADMGSNIVFGAQGIERMRITAAGNVGIGTTNPSDRLTILGPSSATISGGYAAISLYNSNGGQNLSGSDVLSTQISMGPYGPYFQAKYANNTYTDSMRLDICTGAASNNTTPVPRISVLSGINSGYVGIGTTAPTNLLTVAQLGSNYSAPVLILDAGIVGNTTAGAPRGIGKPLLGIGNSSFTGGAVAGDYYGIGFGYGGGGSSSYYPAEIGLYVQTTSGSTWGDLVFSARNVTSNTVAPERMRITGAGNVGIGLTNPNVALQVNGAINSINTTFNVTTSATNLYVLTNGQSGWLFLRWGNGNSLYFFQWYGGVNSSSINLICTAGGGNTVTAALPSTTITLVSNTTMTVYYTITFMT